jgi:hypothetical protein
VRHRGRAIAPPLLRFRRAIAKSSPVTAALAATGTSMRAETEKLVEDIKRSLGLLRRYL